MALNKGILFALLLSFCGLVWTDNDGTFYILIDSVNAYACNGVNNRVTIDKSNVRVKGPNGEKLYYITAPGTYQLNFHNIQVNNPPLPNLVGEMSTTLSVPLVHAGNIVNFDIPYQVIPQSHLLGPQTCDNESGVVQVDGKPMCRYCDICMTNDDVEKALQKNYNYVPGLGSGDQESFSKICGQVDKNTYELVRTVNLPDYNTLKKQYESDSKGQVDKAVEEKFKVGAGKLVVKLQLRSGQTAVEKKQAFFSRTPGAPGNCPCCLKSSNGGSSCQNSIFGFSIGGNSCQMDTCNTKWAQSCLPSDSSVVACYSVEFNFKATKNFTEVQQWQNSPNGQKVKQCVDNVGASDCSGTSSGGSNNVAPATNSGTAAESCHTGNPIFDAYCNRNRAVAFCAGKC